MLFFLLFAALLILTCLLALFRGDKWDRIGAGLFVLALIISYFADVSRTGVLSSLSMPIAFIDTLVFLSLFVLAVISDKFWPIWAAGFQLVTVLTHLAVYVQPDTKIMAYMVSLGIWSFPTVGALLVSLLWRWRTRVL